MKVMRSVMRGRRGLVWTGVRGNKQGATANLYEILTVSALTGRRGFSSGPPDASLERAKIRVMGQLLYEFNQNLYDLFKVNKDASFQEIERAYRAQAAYFDPAKTGDQANAQYFEELTLAFQTLSNPQTRKEYDEYLSSLGAYRPDEKEQLDPEEVERRRRERGKQRFMEDFHFLNEDFFNMWRQRTKQAHSEQAESETHSWFDAQPVHLRLPLSLEETLFGEQPNSEFSLQKTVSYSRQVSCPKCQGSREQEAGESSPVCYSCKGSGVRKDPLFRKESKCNTCKGFGSLVRSPCKACQGEGLVDAATQKTLKLAQFIEDGEQLHFKGEGHQSVYAQGAHGNLEVTVHVSEQGGSRRLKRKGLNVLEEHFISLGDSLNGSLFEVLTLKGRQ
jgi:molecular chaperone DnaJ